ncbi:MAG: hypothetical protein DMG93_11560 [Acidobacteria bacterium]|nr:MAG: hypothetical protein DMG93_11560 [Acidobacteriota bacterium]
MRQRKLINLALLLSLIMAAFAAETTRKEVAVKGYVLDSACAFTKGLKKPISAECACFRSPGRTSASAKKFLSVVGRKRL